MPRTLIVEHPGAIHHVMDRRNRLRTSERPVPAASLDATAAELPLLNPEGALSLSPGLRGTSYPGYPARDGTNPERVASFQPARGLGAGLRYNACRVDGVLVSVSQGSSCLATLGWTMESLWDSRKEQMEST
jgi:hypothetical protein